MSNLLDNIAEAFEKYSSNPLGDAIYADVVSAVTKLKKRADNGDTHADNLHTEVTMAMVLANKFSPTEDSNFLSVFAGFYQNGSHEFPQDYKKALYLYKMAAEDGYVKALAFIGDFHAQGLGVTRSDYEALVWYKKAAEKGWANAQYNVGQFYHEGRGGVAQDTKTAKIWWERAATQGHADAQFNVGYCYGEGIGGVEQNINKAKIWWEKAAAQGHEDAKINLECIDNGSASGGTSSSGSSGSSSGCYIATAVYGSYDCPPVWVLRRYRDRSLSSHAFGRIFIKAYYAIAPVMVRIFGKNRWFNSFCKSRLDKFVAKLKSRGYDDAYYKD